MACSDSTIILEHQLAELARTVELYAQRQLQNQQVTSNPSQFGYRANGFTSFGHDSNTGEIRQQNQRNFFQNRNCSPIWRDDSDCFTEPGYAHQNHVNADYAPFSQNSAYPSYNCHFPSQYHDYYPQYQNHDSSYAPMHNQADSHFQNYDSEPQYQNPVQGDFSSDLQYQNHFSDPSAYAPTLHHLPNQISKNAQWSNDYGCATLSSQVQNSSTSITQLSTLEESLQTVMETYNEHFDRKNQMFKSIAVSVRSLEEKLEQHKRRMEEMQEEEELSATDIGNDIETELNISNENHVLLSCVGELSQVDGEWEENQLTTEEKEQELVIEAEIKGQQFFMSNGKEAELSILHANSGILDCVESLVAAKEKLGELEEQPTMEDELVQKERKLGETQEETDSSHGSQSELNSSYTDFASLINFAGTLANEKVELQEISGVQVTTIAEKEEVFPVAVEDIEEEQGRDETQPIDKKLSKLDRIAAAAIDDMTMEDFDYLLCEEIESLNELSKTNIEQQLMEEKKEEAPISQEINKAAEPLQPQVLSPKLNEAETVEFIISEPLPSDFELTNNLCFLVVNVMISGGKVQKKQWNLKIAYKLQITCLYGEMYMKGANGDGVIWNIKVHPP